MHEGIEEMIKGILHGAPDKKAKNRKEFLSVEYKD